MIEISSIETYNQGWDQWPLGVRQMIAMAEVHGWAVRTGFSRGEVPGRKRDTWAMRDMIGVWVDGYGHRAVAWWERNPDSDTVSGYSWKAAGTAIWPGGRPSPGTPAFPYANVADFKEWLTMRGVMAADFMNRHIVRECPLQDVPLPPIQGCELPPAMRKPAKVGRKSAEAS